MEKNDFKHNLKYPKVYTNPEQKDIEEKFFHLLDDFQQSNSFKNREFLCYLTSAIYLTYRELFPQLNIYIPFRTKSDTSFIKNVQKEFCAFIKDKDAESSFDTTPILKDISGLKIVLNNINFALPSTQASEELFNDPEIIQLIGRNNDNQTNQNRYTRCNNFNFIDQVNDYIQSPIKSGKQYLELKKELLERIINITPSEFTEERKPQASFAQLLDETQYQYDYFCQGNNFPIKVSELEITQLKKLLNDLRSRIDDQLHFVILRKTLPIVFNSPLIRNVLKTSFQEDKETLKPNGFQAKYLNLHTPFGPIEVQSQSNKAYYTATKGSAYHSGMNGKTVPIQDFFELVDPNDEHDISYYLDALDSFSADKLISPYEIPEFETKEDFKEFLKTPDGTAYLVSEKYREMMEHIQIKETIQVGSSTLNANEYLFSTALALSPYMNVCSSSHTSFTTAGIHHKKVIGEFAEILRKRDSNTCLRDLLIRRLEQLIEHPKKFSGKLDPYLKIVKEHDKVATKLPKDISKKNIINFGYKLRNKQKFHPNDKTIEASNLGLVI